MLNALRLTGGFEADLFQTRTGLDLQAVAPQLREAVDLGLLDIDPLRIRPTAFGLRFLNDLVARFLPGKAACEPLRSDVILC